MVQAARAREGEQVNKETPMPSSQEETLVALTGHPSGRSVGALGALMQG